MPHSLVQRTMVDVGPVIEQILDGWDGVSAESLAMQAGVAGYLTGAGRPAAEAMQAVRQWMAAGNVEMPSPRCPGVPWLVPGPAAGAPYYRVDP